MTEETLPVPEPVEEPAPTEPAPEEAAPIEGAPIEEGPSAPEPTEEETLRSVFNEAAAKRE